MNGAHKISKNKVFFILIPWIEEPGGLQSIGLHRVRHDWSDLATMLEDMPLYG